MMLLHCPSIPNSQKAQFPMVPVLGVGSWKLGVFWFTETVTL
jgi:hypothetical protein